MPLEIQPYIDNSAPVVALYYAHHSASKIHALQQRVNSAVQMGTMPLDIHGWPLKVSDRISQLRPNFISVDGITANSPMSDIILAMPVDPFTLRNDQDYFIIGGDPVEGTNFSDKLIDKKHIKNAFWDPSLPEDHPDLAYIHKIISNPAVFFGFASMAALRFGNTEPAMVLLIANMLGLARMLAFSCLQHIGNNPSFPPHLYENLMRWTMPIFNNPKDTSIRNAVIAIKNYEAVERYQEVSGDSTPAVSVALLGSAHVLAQTPWNNITQLEQIVAERVRFFLRSVSSDTTDFRSDIGLQQGLTDALKQYLGSTTVWRVKERPETNKVEDVARQIPIEDQFISQRISEIIDAVASQVFV